MTEAVMNYGELRRDKDRFFKQDSASPLMPEQREHFEALNYFPPDPALDLVLTPEVFSEKANVKIPTTKGDFRYYQRWGRITFRVGEQEGQLTMYHIPGESEFFIPFRDSTSGTETYGAGRYIEAELLPSGKVHINFNFAYNPYCAYNEPPELAAPSGREPRTWSCPIPPRENHLKIPIRAGEKKPTGAWVIAEHD
ncbi:MAG TPA: DUF1684 domain-containing protein [Aggregatilineales bacterium]|nr:DUF1684 domain-containing protein [Aggregatilineales bacterium]